MLNNLSVIPAVLTSVSSPGLGTALMRNMTFVAPQTQVESARHACVEDDSVL